MAIRRIAILVSISAAATVTASALLWALVGESEGGPAMQPVSYQELTGSVFDVGVFDPSRGVRVTELPLPDIPDATAVWGATGRDSRGHIWVGVSATSNGMSAYLLEFNPAQGSWRNHGAVVDQLRRAGLHRGAGGQIKIHSKIVPGADGRLYFASSDEEGETEGGVLPRWGGHLWRIDPRRGEWEHLLATPEGLIAVSGVGRYLYALGYWGHVLYQYDTQRGSQRRVVVGSIEAHVSRNFLADMRGHAYVPRVRTEAGTPVAELVEFDSDLRELAATPLDFYLGQGSINANHGITGIAYLPDGRMLFATQRGYLYLIEPQHPGPARVIAIGWLHPEGDAYAPGLFVWGGANWVAGLALRERGYEWVTHDLRTGLSSSVPLDVGQLRKLLLYGSITRDDRGRAYVGGWAGKEGGSNMRPVVLQIEATP